MLRILIADDERLTRRGLLAMLQRDIREDVEWLEAGNGEEALRLVRRRPVDLAITDICMPLRNGLEFVEELRQGREDLTVVIISGYANFDYAKQAVRLGVKDYIMKPVDKEEFLGVVERCIADIHKKRQDAEEEILRQAHTEQVADELQQESLRRLLEGNGDAFSLRTLGGAGLDPSAAGFCCASLAYDAASGPARDTDRSVRQQARVYLAARKTRCLTTTVWPGCTGILFWGGAELEGLSPVLRDLSLRVERLCRVHAVCGVGGTVYSPEQIPAAFLQSQRASDRKLGGGWGPLLVFREIQAAPDPLFSRSLLEHWEPGCGQQILWAFQSGMTEPLTQGGAERLRISYDLLREEAEGRSRSSGEPTRFRRFSDLWSYFELRSEVEAMIQQFETDPGGSPLAKELIHYTIDHATEDIDLNHLASRFGKTPGYVGKLFRQGCHMGFNEFVTNERMKLAKRLLRSPDLSIQKVGEACGYHDAKYFSTAFKKVTGISPRQYRERGMRG